MNRLVLIAAALLATAPVLAGVRVESTARDIQTQVADGGPDVVLIQDGMLKSTHAQSTETTLVKQGVFYLLDDKAKTWYALDEAAVKQAAADTAVVMKKMQEEVKKWPAEQRATYEKAMGAHMPGVFGKKNKYSLSVTGRNETVEGRACSVWLLVKNGTPYEEYCVAPFSSLPGKEDFEKAFHDLWDAFDAVTMGLANASDYVDVRQSIKGYPVRIRSLDGGEQLRAREVVVTKWVEESLPASTFEIPAGYKETVRPQMEQ